MSKRRYNKTTYKAFAKVTKAVRNHCSDEPLEEIKKTGLTGEMLGNIIDKPIDKITHKFSKSLTGVCYDKKKDSPYKGSAVYTAWWLFIKKTLKCIVVIILATVPFTCIKRFFEADFLSQILMMLGMMPIVLFGLGIYKLVTFIKGM